MRLGKIILSVKLILVGAVGVNVHGAGSVQHGVEDRAEVRMEPKTVRSMIRMLETGSTRSAARAAIALGKAGVSKPSALSALKGMLESESVAARCSALYALGRSEEASVAPAVIPLLSDSSPEVRIDACRALARVGDVEHSNKLPLMDSNEYVQVAAVEAVAQLGTEKGAKPLIGVFRRSESTPVRLAVLRALSSVEETSAVEDVVRSALKDDEPQLRAEALKLLSSMSVQVLNSYKDVLEEYLQAEASIVRREAVGLYLEVCAENSSDFSAGVALLDDPDATVRVAAAEALGAHCESVSDMLRLEALFVDPVRKVRRSASEAMLEAVQRHPQWQERLEAVAVKAVEASRSVKRREGIWILGQLESQAVFPEVLKLIRRPSAREDIREARLAVWLIWRTEYQKGGSLLMKLFTHDDQPVRIHAAKGLGVLRHKPAVDFISRKLKETKIVEGEEMFSYKNPERYYAIWALGQLANEKVLRTLTELAVKQKPRERLRNVELICDILSENKYKKGAQTLVQVCRLQENMSISRKRLFAETIYRITGTEKVAIPSEEEFYSYQNFFINSLNE